MSGVFLSYRREETQGTAGRLADRLVERLGEDDVFIDVDQITPGSDFVEAVERAVGACDVLVALIGPRWAQVTDRRGRRRLDDPDDPVAFEIGLALRRAAPVIPVLVDGADMPDREDLPPSLRGLERRTAVRLDHATFLADIVPLLDAVAAAVQRPRAPFVPPPPGSAPVRLGNTIVYPVGTDPDAVARLGQLQKTAGETKRRRRPPPPAQPS